MRFNKQVALSGEAPNYPIELSDVVVGMNNLGWAPLRPDRFVLRRRSLFSWPLRTLRRIPIGPNRNGKGGSDVSYWIEAKIDEAPGQRTLAMHGRVPLSERGKLDALLEALQQGRRWLTPQGPLG
jgi:hypothetical protein